MDAEALFGVALLILLFGAISRRAERSPLTPPMFFIAAGCLVSEHGLGLVDLEVTGSVVHTLAEITGNTQEATSLLKDVYDTFDEGCYNHIFSAQRSQLKDADRFFAP